MVKSSYNKFIKCLSYLILDIFYHILLSFIISIIKKKKVLLPFIISIINKKKKVKRILLLFLSLSV